eukprot:NODE_11637_length_1274_cov_4.408893.p1 GENE.NODE_11637_length_1274_cov_4.408893~~NODE_11637_length_1274_cov_4.408893.p1  ORF type:complete len:315 (-),score=39.57 NODE_11637_length_1274_cov_4.408893:61-1005(-)
MLSNMAAVLGTAHCNSESVHSTAKNNSAAAAAAVAHGSPEVVMRCVRLEARRSSGRTLRCQTSVRRQRAAFCTGRAGPGTCTCSGIEPGSRAPGSSRDNAQPLRRGSSAAAQAKKAVSSASNGRSALRSEVPSGRGHSAPLGGIHAPRPLHGGSPGTWPGCCRKNAARSTNAKLARPPRRVSVRQRRRAQSFNARQSAAAWPDASRSSSACTQRSQAPRVVPPTETSTDTSSAPTTSAVSPRQTRRITGTRALKTQRTTRTSRDFSARSSRATWASCSTARRRLTSPASPFPTSTMAMSRSESASARPCAQPRP